jgi:hypothetical protein
VKLLPKASERVGCILGSGKGGRGVVGHRLVFSLGLLAIGLGGDQ